MKLERKGEVKGANQRFQAVGGPGSRSGSRSSSLTEPWHAVNDCAVWCSLLGE